MSAPRLFRVIMPVANIDDAARFYSELLGAPGFRVSDGRHYFDCGGVILALFDPMSDGDRRTLGHNPEHVYFAVQNLQEIFARAKRLGGLSTAIGDGGLAMGEINRRPWGEVSFYLDDPFGNPLCFVDEASVFRGGPPQRA